MTETARRDRRRLITVIAVAEVLVAIATATVVVLSLRHLDSNIETLPEIPHDVEPPAAPAEPEAKTPLNNLVMGSDTRAGKGNHIDGQPDDTERSDVTVLLHVSADRKTVYGVSIPRDAMVARPSCEGLDGDRLAPERAVIFNDAFSVGGPLCTVRQVEHVTGVYVDHTVVIDFNGFRGMVDAVGGVEICVPEEVDDPAHDIHLAAGRDLADSDAALAYVRERHVLSVNSDIGRMRRQQAFMASMVGRVLSADTLANPRRLFNFLDAATSSIAMDQGLASLRGLVDLVSQVGGTNADKIKFVTAPLEPYPPDINRLQLAPGATNLWRLVRRDEPLGRFGRKASSAGDKVGSPDDEGDSEAAAERRANGLCA